MRDHTLRALAAIGTLAATLTSSASARADDAIVIDQTPEQALSARAYAYPQQGLVFFPEGPGKGNRRATIGGIWQVAPMVTASYMAGLGSGFSFDVRIKTIVLYNQFGIGTGWGTRIGPFSLGVMAHVDEFLGTLGKALIATTSFDAVGWGTLVEPGIKAGLQVAKDSWLTLQYEAYLSVFQATKIGSTVLRPDSPTYAGFGLSLVVEYARVKESAIYYGVSLYNTTANYPIWFNVETSGSTEAFTAKKISYLGLLVGYEL